jgi:hypothetical protein
MASFNGSRVVVGAGTLYAAPLNTLEPASVTGAWPSGWVTLGYTDTGSSFDITPKVSPVEVEEEYWPIRQAITSYEGSLTFALAEATAQNLMLALNAGFPIGSPSSISQTADTTTNVGTYPGSANSQFAAGTGDGTIWVTPPIAGTESRVMLGWDSLPEGTTSPPASNPGFTLPFQRLVARQCLQTGAMKMMHRKGNNKLTYACVFSLEKPPQTSGLPDAAHQPVTFLFPASLVS